MTNVVRFPGWRRSPPLAPADELAALQIEIAKAQRVQMGSETRHANVLWFSYCVRRLLFWGAVVWLLKAIV
jgi:hypothetical protein